MALINGRAYDYSQIQILLGGVPIVSASAITYTESQEKPNNYGTGTRPVSRGRGTIEPTVSMDIAMNDVEALRDSVTDSSRSLLKLPSFDILVIFGNTEQGIVTHTLKECEFTDDGVEGTTGDGELKRTFSLACAEINY